MLNFPLHLLEIISEVTVSKDVPGFVSNALLMPFINEVTHIKYLFCVKHVFILLVRP